MERRHYQRFPAELDCNLYFKNREIDHREFSGTLENLSEAGMRLKISRDKNADFIDKVNIGDSILFQTADEYKYGSVDEVKVFIGEAKVVRVDEAEDYIKLGCYIISISTEYQEYIRYKEIQMFRGR